jgi:hypothetical protein
MTMGCANKSNGKAVRGRRKQVKYKNYVTNEMISVEFSTGTVLLIIWLNPVICTT